MEFAPEFRAISLSNPRKDFFQIGRLGGFSTSWHPGTDGESFSVVFKPHKESGLLGAGEALLVDPVVVGTKIGIHQRAGRIHVGLILVGRQQIVRGLRPRSEAYEQSDGLRTPQHFARSPLRKGCAEYLRSGTFR